MVDGAYENVASSASGMDRALEAGQGIVQLAPTWVPRAFCTPGRRIRLHPDDYFPFAQGRGGIDERWLSSAVRADNGPLTGANEGLSLVVDPDGGALLPFDEFVGHHKGEAIGERLWTQHEKWPMYSKFFDNQQALPFHVHHTDEKAALVDKPGKPEAYYYSPHMNNHLGDQPISFLGFQPEVTTDQVKARLMRFGDGGDNRITDLSRGYRTQLGTGWDIPSGVLHAPASICTYEPQAACDVFCMCESWSNNREVPEELLWKDVPPEHHGDFDFIISLLDWEKNTDPNFVTNRFMAPYSTAQSLADGETAYVEKWIVYRSPHFSAKELTVRPGQSVTVTDADAYGLIAVQGTGTLGTHDIAAATLIRFGQLSQDEFFVTESAARAGVTVTNRSATQDLVILKHFGPENAELGLHV
ncbi:hypothetical protein CLV85_0073 [Salinibacterium amurskyense]|uniref:Mannose-6-phosphate isomerase class I n=1 Tax=Salinibacterium amurskyense TaxID=205941 RepID=A0A2M9D5A4_9MICO|nr:hypothetical protein [Salinibacterium amurskyense]PJJ80906.1 hypothetical protein CLV85_0073 [Salinibacterium amurskyense]RLQ83777.1 hypothetical protein D9C83_00365 [Salinibacterium amurskyense]GHD82088.1 hypothetical protein GCM10007394_17310 [Salinibacterium amurskyense]